MAVDILKKNQETVKKVLLAKKLEGFECEVNFVCDISGSTSYDFRRGTIQELLTGLFSISSVVDRDKRMGMYVFNNSAKKLTDVTMKNYKTYVEEEVAKYVGGGTVYSKAMKMAYQDSKKCDTLTINIVLTDGQNDYDDNENVMKLIQESSGSKVFWLFVCYGGSIFPHINDLKNLKGRINKNVDYLVVSSLKQSEVEDKEKFYTIIFRQIPDFLANYREEKPSSLFDKVKNLFK
jgi:hypothetical protein